jgi:glycosyltransferase involved in cell wall biosynthesis
VASAVTAWQLVVDAQGVQGPFNERGIARTVTALSDALVARGAPVSAVLLNPHHPLPPSWHASLRNLPLMWSTAAATEALVSGPPIVWLMLSPMEGSFPDEAIVPRFVADGRAAIVPLIHDAIPFDDTLRYQRRHADARMHQYRLPLLRQASRTLAVSRHSANEWSRLVYPLPSVTVVGSAPTPPSTAPLDPLEATAASRLAVAGLNRAFAVYVGGDDARKNVVGAIEAWAMLGPELHRQFQFVVVGSARPQTLSAWRSGAADLGLGATDVLFTGRLSDASLDVLHQAAHLAFFPSLSEGFGMPVVEALAWGTPVICSNTTSLPEIVGWAPGMFDPTATHDMSRVLRRALVDETFRTELHAAGDAARERHTWAAVAARICETLEAHVVPNLSATPRKARPAIAIVTSDSAPDGLAARLVAELAADADVDRFMPNPTDGAFPIEAFGRTTDPGRFDVRVFVLGDHAEGAAAFILARRFPGVLVLTDERLTHLGATAAGENLASLLADAYDTRLPSAVATVSQPSVDVLIDHDVRLLAPVVQPAHRVIATTEAIAAAAALDIGPWHRPVPTDVAASAAHIAAVLRAQLAVVKP